MKAGNLVLVGERDLAKRAHVAIEASLGLYQRDRDPALKFQWVSTAELAAGKPGDILGDATGIWCTPGSPYADTAGALEAIRHAREHHIPFIGTCGGFQHALMEYCASVLRHAAIHQELASEAIDPLISKLSCSLIGVRARVIAPAGSWYAATVGAPESIEEFNCNYGLSPALEPLFAGSEIQFVARDDAGQVRAFHLAKHPFFVGSLFQPERRALAGSLHPLVNAFLEHT